MSMFKRMTSVFLSIFSLFAGSIVLLFAANSHALDGVWETDAPKPTPAYARAGVVNGKLHVLGGTGYSTVHEVYDPVADLWMPKAPLPVGRAGPAVEGIGGKLYVVGGDIGSNTGTATMVIYDAATDTWSSGAPMPSARNSMASGVINGKLYVAGGDIAGVGAPQDSLYAYDPATNTWATKASLPLPRRTAAASVIGDKMYVVGGLEACCTSKPELQIYDSLTNSWSVGTPMPAGRNQLIAGAINGKLYAVTGINAAGNGLANDAWEYDPVSDTWTAVTAIPTARNSAGAGVIGGKLYVAAGGTPTGLSDVLEAFTPGPAEQIAAIDVKPGSCPNPINVNSKGVTPVAIAGAGDLDVSQVDPATVRLEGVAPLRTSIEDVTTPHIPAANDPIASDCTTAGPDGYADLTLKFATQSLVQALGAISDGDVRVLSLTGMLQNGTPIHGKDVVVLLKKK